MIINSNSYYQIGNSHKFCEDFALHGKNSDGVYAIVCDGCSSSGFENGFRNPINVDFGARVLAFLAKQTIEEFGIFNITNHFPELMHRDMLYTLVEKSKKFMRDFNVSSSFFDVTLVVSVLSRDGLDYTMVLGDGCVLYKSSKTKSYKVYNVRFPSGAPFYISYLLDDKRKDIYFSQFDNKKIIEKISFQEDGESDKENVELKCDDYVFFQEDFYEQISIFSDGIESFKESSGKNLFEIALTKFIDFSNTKGEFAIKNFNVLNTWMKKNNVVHYDDLAMGSIVVEN